MKSVKFVFVILFTLIFSLPSPAAFRENSRRYLAPFDWFMMQQKPFAGNPESKGYWWQCGPQSYPNLQDTLGSSNPLVGAPLSLDPGPSFVSQHLKCLLYSVNLLENITLLKPELFDRLLGAVAVDQIKVKFKVDDRGVLYRYQQSAKNIDANILRSISKFHIERLLGDDDVLKDFGVLSSISELQNLLEIQWNLFAVTEAPMGREKTLADYVKFILVSIQMREEFLSY
jgi:hypothetical protein